MSDCSEARDRIAELRHGRLSPDGRAALARHLDGCAACRAFDESERELDRALARLPRRTAPEALRARLAGPPAAPRRALAPRRVITVGVGAALAGAALGALGWFNFTHAADEVVAEAVNDHLRVLYAAQPLEIASGGIHQVKPWFEGKLDFAPVLGFEGDSEFSLAGGSVAYFVDRKAAAFVFKRRLHLITLFVLRADGLPWPRVSNQKLGRRSAFRAHSRGFNVLFFRDSDLGYALVSDTEPATLVRLGERIESTL
jgi:anti-sigma factor (TIGR02949 family)